MPHKDRPTRFLLLRLPSFSGALVQQHGHALARARNAFRTHLHQPSLFSRTRVSLSTHLETNDPVELRKRLDAVTQRCELAERRLRELQALHRRERRGSWRFLAMWRRLFNRSKLSRVDPQVKP